MSTSGRAARGDLPAGQIAAWIAGSAVLGAAAVESAFAAVSLALSALLLMMPTMALFAVAVVSGAVEGVSHSVRGYMVRPEMLVAVLFAARAFALKRRARIGRTGWALIAFLAVQVVASVLGAPSPAASLRSVALYGFGALAFLATLVTMSTVDRFIRGLRIFLAIMAASASIGIAFLVSHFAIGSSFGVTYLDTLAGLPAATGFAYEHDLFGSACAAAAIVFLVLRREQFEFLSTKAATAGFWICSVGTLASLSRGAWIGYAAGLLVALFVSGGLGRDLARLAVAGAAALLVIGIYAAVFAPSSVTQGGISTASAITTQAGRTLDLSSSTGAARVREWRLSLEEVAPHWLLGLGTNSFGQRHAVETVFGPRPAFVGNWLIRIFYDSGVLGLALFLAFVGPIVWPSRNIRRAAGASAPAARALVAGCLVLAVAYLATDSLLLVWPWILLGLTCAARRLSEERIPEETSGHRELLPGPL